jgi:hypothetical protein
LRSQRASPANLFVLSDLNDKDIPDVTEKIKGDESMDFGDNSGFIEKDDNNRKSFTRFNHTLTFSYGSNQEDEKFFRKADKVVSFKRFIKTSRSKKARGKRLVTVIGKPKQSQVTKGVKCACNPLVNREWLGELDEWVTKND